MLRFHIQLILRGCGEGTFVLSRLYSKQAPFDEDVAMIEGIVQCSMIIGLQLEFSQAIV